MEVVPDQNVNTNKALEIIQAMTNEFSKKYTLANGSVSRPEFYVGNSLGNNEK